MTQPSASAPLVPSPAKVLVQNAGALVGGQAVALLAPLIAVPYLARVLRPEGWAPVLAAQALAAWIVLILEYGFDLSGTRAVAQARHTPELMPEVVRGVQSAKLILLPVATLVVLFAFWAVPILAEHRDLLPWTLALAVVRGFNPFWYFQGVERVRTAAGMEAGTRALAAAGVVVAVHDPGDAWRVLALQAGFAAVSLVVLTARMARTVPLLPPRSGAGVAVLRESWTIFAYRAAGGVYTQASALILGFVGSALSVASFGGAERIMRAAIVMLQPLTQAFFPRVSFMQAKDPAAALRLIRRCLWGVGLFGGVMGIVALVAAPIIVPLLLGRGYEDAVPLMRVLAILPPLVAVNTVMSLYWAVPFGHEKVVLASVGAAAVANIALVWLLVPRWGAIGMCAAVVGSEVVVTFLLGAFFVSRQRAR